MYLCPTEDLALIADSLKSDFDELYGKRIFLAGATGFIGKNLLESLLWANEKHDLGIKIFSVSRDIQKFFSQYPHFRLHSQFKLYECNMCEDLDDLPIDRIDLTIHAATDVINQGSPLDILNNCIQGTVNILNFSKKKGCQKFLLLSSGAIYGAANNKTHRFEESNLGAVNLFSPKSAYALGKQLSEWITHQSANQSMQVKVARCFAFVGPYLPLNQHFAIGNFIKSALLNEDIEIKGDGTPLRTYLYTSDLCVWLLKILINGLPNCIYNVGGREVLSIRELADVVKNQLNSTIKVNVHQLPRGVVDAYIPNLEKIGNELDLYPTVLVREAITKTANWNLKYAHIK